MHKEIIFLPSFVLPSVYWVEWVKEVLAPRRIDVPHIEGIHGGRLHYPGDRGMSDGDL